MQFGIVCPICMKPIRIDLDTTCSCKCTGGHKFHVVNGIIDFMSSSKDCGILLEEQRYWDNVAEKGWVKILPNAFMDKKIRDGRSTIFKQAIKYQWPDYRTKNVLICEIGCGSGSALSYLDQIEFLSVGYVGIDISIKMLQLACDKPRNWKTLFVRSDVDKSIFMENSLDVVFSVSVLSHFQLNTVIKWISKALKPGGLFILDEPSARNLFARIGRKLIKKRSPFFYTSSTRLLPNQVKEIASKYNLKLVHEKGLHFLVCPLYYLLGIFNIPTPVTVPLYYIARSIDHLVTSPSWNYSFVHVYQKESN